MTNKLKRVFTICNKRGLHARASAKFVKCAEMFDAKLEVQREGETVPATSIMGLMMLGARLGSQIVVTGEGSEAQDALDSLQTLIENRFDEAD